MILPLLLVACDRSPEDTGRRHIPPAEDTSSKDTAGHDTDTGSDDTAADGPPVDTGPEPAEEKGVWAADRVFHGRGSYVSGVTLSAGGDVDGDGLPDLLAGSKWDRFYLWGSATLPATTDVEAESAAHVFWAEPDYAYVYGPGGDIVPDMDGDGLAEVVITRNDLEFGSFDLYLGSTLATRGRDHRGR